MPIIAEVIFSRTSANYIVLSKDVPNQVIQMSDIYSDEWNSVNDDNGDAVCDIQVWFDDSVEEEDENKYWGCQTVNLEKDEKGNIHMGYDWDNPDKFTIIDEDLKEYLEKKGIEYEWEKKNV